MGSQLSSTKKRHEHEHEQQAASNTKPFTTSSEQWKKSARMYIRIV